MKVEQFRWEKQQGWNRSLGAGMGSSRTLLLMFGSREAFREPGLLAEVSSAFPGACSFGCSTAGEIEDTNVHDGSLVLTAVQFESVRIQGASRQVACAEDSWSAGQQLGLALAGPDLSHVVVLSDGLHVNGTDLVAGLVSALPSQVTVTGGLAADGDRFEQTLVLLDGELASAKVAAIGLYGSRLRVGCASRGGWDPFGPERLITRSKGNELYELDGRSALDLYREYLGDYAKELPAMGLYFPLSLRTENGGEALVRTILGINAAAGSLIFAGDMPQGSYARLMKANSERLIDGAAEAAMICSKSLDGLEAEFALLISCVGRKLVLKQRTEEEVENVREVMGPRPVLSGFYSYGEVSPFSSGERCELHNQTMTITAFAELG
jgi:hypothetical protein